MKHWLSGGRTHFPPVLSTSRNTNYYLVISTSPYATLIYTFTISSFAVLLLAHEVDSTIAPSMSVDIKSVRSVLRSNLWFLNYCHTFLFIEKIFTFYKGTHFRLPWYSFSLWSKCKPSNPHHSLSFILLISMPIVKSINLDTIGWLSISFLYISHVFRISLLPSISVSGNAYSFESYEKYFESVKIPNPKPYRIIETQQSPVYTLNRGLSSVE